MSRYTVGGISILASVITFLPIQSFTNAIPTLQTEKKRKQICLFSQKSNKRRFAETNKSTTFVGDLENRNYVFLIISLKKS